MTERKSEEKAIIVALTGASSSGKSTLARALLKILPNAFILHQDDFYRPEAELPDLALASLGGKNWDSPAAFDFSKLLATVKVIQSTGSPGEGFKSLEAEAHEATSDKHPQLPISDTLLEQLRKKIENETPPTFLQSKRVCLLDGLHLLSSRDLQEHLTLKLFLRSTKQVCKSRREKRPDYLTMEGWWADPPHYFDKVVWPEYVASHAFLFQEGDVEGLVDDSAVGEARVSVSPAVDGGIEESVSWAVDSLIHSLQPGNTA